MNIFNEKQLLNMALDAKKTNYLTHGLHPYPAKFIPQIPNMLIKEFTKPDDVILDPFCGSGTSLVESKLLGRNSIGVDLHLLATFLSKVKTTKISKLHLQNIPKILLDIEKTIDTFYNLENKNKSETKWGNFELPDFSNRDHWFQRNVLFELAIIKGISKKNPKNLSDLLLCAMSAIIVPVSNQHGETRYAAIEKNILPKKTFNLFKDKTLNFISRISDFNDKATNSWIKIHNADSRKLDFLKNGSVDFIITSPPYANTFEYYLYHKHRMNWLDMNWQNVRDNEIGSRYVHSSRREGIDTYVDALEPCFAHFNRILKKKKYFVIIIGDSVIQQQKFSGMDITKKLALKTGFEIIQGLNYELDSTSKLFIKSFRQKGKKEHILLLQKP